MVNEFWRGTGSGKVRVPGLGHERQERVKFLIGLERAAAQLADRGDRVRAWRGADQLIQRHQITVATGLRYLSGIRARGNRLRRPAPTVCAGARERPWRACRYLFRGPLVPTGTYEAASFFRIMSSA